MKKIILSVMLLSGVVTQASACCSWCFGGTDDGESGGQRRTRGKIPTNYQATGETARPPLNRPAQAPAMTREPNDQPEEDEKRGGAAVTSFQAQQLSSTVVVNTQTPTKGLTSLAQDLSTQLAAKDKELKSVREALDKS